MKVKEIEIYKLNASRQNRDIISLDFLKDLIFNEIDKTS